MSVRQILNPAHGRAKALSLMLALIAMLSVWAMPAAAQDAPYYSPDQLDHLVQRIALYPDPLLAQTLAAATFPDEIPDAARWAEQHRNLSGDQLAARIQDDQLPWDPSVQALLPFPNVLGTMASNMDWTTDLGNAFLANQQDVMFAVQRMRQRARDYGYLRSGPQIVVAGGPYITIMPTRPDYVVVPYYDPVVVYAAPRPGFFVGAAIGFRFGVGLGVAFRPWGWGYNRISWNERVVVVNNAPWHRTWVNRTVYVHPYAIRRVVVHDRGWNDRHEAMERERDHFAHERAVEHHEAERHEEHREAVRHEEHREAVRQEERHDAIRDAHHDDHHDAYRDDHHDAHHDDHHDAHPQPVHEAHNDVGHVERHDNGHPDNHSNSGHGNDNHGNNGNHNGKDKDKDDKHGDHDGHGR